MNTMSISELTDQVAKVCKENGVKRLDMFGSFATGTAAPTSDIFDYDSIHNQFL